MNCYLNNAIPSVLKEVISRLDLSQGKCMGNQGSGIQLPCLNQRKNFFTMTTIYPTCFESQILSIHLWQGENLRAVIHRHNGDDGIGAGALPGQLKRVRATGNFQNNVCAAVCALFPVWWSKPEDIVSAQRLDA